ncbi:ATP-binding protein [Pseudorhodoferax soli]|uniref:Putative ATPase n=1 Tax=Pseudorhodoferax soli TaxID=545864 RepID=A0A368XFA3_9BURK|nr:AAA family ATPase [Pseudorhodoferax soli]RCW64694.1 putative ATPase [Pseudorhodoferax soli]
MPTVEPLGPAAPPWAELQFGPYRLLGPHGPLLQSGRAVDLPRKPLAILWLLASRAGEVVHKDELLAIVWPRMVVSDGVIATCMRDLRQALGDDARAPRFIATAHRIGYRFIGEVAARAAAAAGALLPQATPPLPDALVGRSAECAVLQAALQRAAAGQRQIVFVTGDAGIGKSRLVDAFVATLGAQRAADAAGTGAARVGQGQCIEHFGAGEPYLPVLEAITRLCRQADGAPLVDLLQRHAPSWTAQMPGVFGHAPHTAALPPAGEDAVQRMPRELAEAVDLAAADRLLVLVLEDMHWSDPSTVDWLAMLARRREPARLLVIATCRPVELIVHGHPLKQVKQDLVTRRLASELVVGRLGAAAVQDYVAQRLPQPGSAPRLAAAVFRRSQGHPLFMVHMVDEVQHASDAVATLDGDTLPFGVRELIEAQVTRLPVDALAALEAASVAGAEFATALVGAALQRPAEEIEQLLETLVRQGHFVEGRGLARWHDGTVSGRYAFRHDLVREGLYRRLGSAPRMRLHAAIGTRLAVAYAEHAGDIAAELALHFEHAQDPWRAAQHRTLAGDKALHRFAPLEALAHAERGLAQLGSARGTRHDRHACDAAELSLRLIEGAALLAIRGFTAPEVEATYTRTLALGVAVNDASAIGPALSGLFNLYLTRAAFAQVQQIADQALALLQRQPDTVLEMLAHNVRGAALLFSGAASACLPHVARTRALYDAQAHAHLAVLYGEDPAMVSHHVAALACWVVGEADETEHHLREGLALTHRMAHPFGEAQMLWMEALIALDGDDLPRAERATLRLDALCAAHGFPLWLAGGQILRGAALAGRGLHDEAQGLTDQGLQAWRDAGTLLTFPHALAVAARVHAHGGRPDKALQHLAEALETVGRTGERWYEPELHRLQGTWLLQHRGDGPMARAEAGACFGRAVVLAREQRAALFERRASASLARLAAAGAPGASAAG